MQPLQPPQARIEFAPGLPARLLHFARAECAARRSPREDASSSSARDGRGAGEFAGRRRYRPGDELRSFDWEALARGAGSLVRLRQRDSGEHWAVLLDSSASMAVGTPPKLQLAAELALAACALGLELGGRVTLATRGAVNVLRSRRDLARGLAQLEGLSAEGRAEPRSLGAHPAVARGSRWILVGDLLDQETAQLQPGARRLDAIAVLAARELAPLADSDPGSAVEWRDPEHGGRLRTRLGWSELAAYERGLSEHLERWRGHVARARGRLVVARAGADFEPYARRLFSGIGA